MKHNVIHFIDDDPAARAANARALQSLLNDGEIRVEEREPYKDLNGYNQLMLRSDTAAFVLDQRMTGNGRYQYNGIDIASHLRALNSKMPLYILTGHSEDEEAFEGQTHLVEYIIGKEEIDDVTSEAAKTVKARMLRNLNTYNDIRDEREDRYQTLLIKSINNDLSANEANEVEVLEAETLRTVLASEQMRVREISKTIEQLQRILPLDEARKEI